MKRREFLRSVGMAPVVAVGALTGVKAAATYEELPMPKHYGLPKLADHFDAANYKAPHLARYWPYGPVQGDPRDYPLDERRTLERYSATLKVPYAAIVDPV